MAQNSNMESHLTMIRAYASVISPNNWRDICLRIEVERKALEAIAASLSSEGAK